VKFLRLLVSCYLFFFISSLLAAQSGPPVARRDNVLETIHGVSVPDPYRWLEDQNSPETRTWIDAENAYTHKLLDAWPGRAKVERRATELLRVDSIRLPIEENDRYFYRKRLANQDLYLIYMRQGLKGEEQLLIDCFDMICVV
jgi:prolyl oligopeptidase